ICAMVVDKVGMKIAGEIPGRFCCVGEESAAVRAVQPEGRTALAEIIDAVIHIQIARRQRAERFKQTPFSLAEIAKVMRVAELNRAQRQSFIQISRRRLRPEKRYITNLT